MRKSNSIKNSISSVISNLVTMIVSFISQAIFIKKLGTEYLGINGLFTNILTILSFFELGIGSAIVYHLYKPIANKDEKSIRQLMNFYRKAYTLISVIVFVCGLIFIPFLHFIVGKISVDINIYIIFMMYLLNTSSSYLLSYKKNIIQANQKSYILNIVHIIYVLVLNTIQIILLYTTRNFYLYLLVKFVCQLFENIVDSIIATKMYPFLKNIQNDKIDKKTEKDIFKKVKALLFHQVGSSIINGTDNIIISTFLGVSIVGLYSNYYVIINAVNVLCRQLIAGTTASVGNLLASSESKEKKYEIFDRLRFINFVISFVCATCILVIIEPFITIWVGEKYLLSFFVTFTLSLNFFQKTQRCVYQTFKDSGGIWYEDRFIPLIESCVNIVTSIIFLKIFGLAGVFMGTIASGLVLWFYSYPKYVYNNLFARDYKKYFIETIRYVLLFLGVSLFTYYISTKFIFESIFIKLLFNCILSLLIPCLVLIIIYRKNENFKYFVDLFKKIIKHKNKKVEI